MYTWSGRSTPSCTWPWVKPRTESHTANIPSARTKASSLSETGDLQGSIWRPGHRVSRLDDLEMKNASNARPSPGLLARADKLDTFLPLCLPLTLALSSLSSLPVWLCHSSSLLPLCLPPRPPGLSFVPHPPRWLVRGRGGTAETGYAVCQPAADVPGGAPLTAEVLNKESLGPGAGGQAVSLSGLAVTHTHTRTHAHTYPLSSL